MGANFWDKIALILAFAFSLHFGAAGHLLTSGAKLQFPAQWMAGKPLYWGKIRSLGGPRGQTPIEYKVIVSLPLIVLGSPYKMGQHF